MVCVIKLNLNKKETNLKKEYRRFTSRFNTVNSNLLYNIRFKLIKACGQKLKKTC